MFEYFLLGSFFLGLAMMLIPFIFSIIPEVLRDLWEIVTNMKNAPSYDKVFLSGVTGWALSSISLLLIVYVWEAPEEIDYETHVCIEEKVDE